MDEDIEARSAQFARLLDVWSGGDPNGLAHVITSAYVGHTLNLRAAERSAADYEDWIRSYRDANPGIVFAVQEQAVSGDRLWSRVRATRGDGRQAHGMNVSRFEGDRIAEEWAVWSDWLE